MANRPQLCVLAPDNLYADSLSSAEFPSFEIKIFKSIDEMERCNESLSPAVCLVFGGHFSRLALAEAVLFIRAKFRAAKILQVEGVSEPAVLQIWPMPVARELASSRVRFNDVESLDAAVQSISAGWEALVEASESLTSTQMEVLAALAAGQTNKEIAVARGTSTRAVESLVNRTFVRVGLGQKAYAGSRAQKAKDYLASLGASSRITKVEELV